MSPNRHLQISPVLAGAPLDRCSAAAILVHGRDQDHEFMLDVAQRLGLDDVAYLLPVAAGRSWYDGRYFDPLPALAPQLGDALEALTHAVTQTVAGGVPRSRVVLAGFSQGASLVAEFLARGGAGRDEDRLKGAAVLTGSLIGAPGGRTPPRDVDGLAMYLSVSRHDPWLALDDARTSAEAFAAAGAVVRFEVLEDRDHLVSDPAILGLRRLLTD